MAYWLIKSEPFKWSWDMQVAAGARGTHWDGVRNHSAKLYLMAMELGDKAFFYHSNEGKAVVGIVEIIKKFYPDPSDASGKFGMVDVRAFKPFKVPVTLDDIKQETKLSKMVLVNNSRLSVQPVTAEEWKLICKMGGISVDPENFMTINYLAIFLAALAAFVFGALWYGLLGKQWMAAIGFDAKDMRDAAGKPKIPLVPMAVSFIAELVMAFVLAGVLAHVAKNGVTLRAGVMTGFICWLGFVITTLATNHAYGKARPSLTLIDGAHWLGVLLIQGAVLGAMG